MYLKLYIILIIMIVGYHQLEINENEEIDVYAIASENTTFSPLNLDSSASMKEKEVKKFENPKQSSPYFLKEFIEFANYKVHLIIITGLTITAIILLIVYVYVLKKKYNRKNNMEQQNKKVVTLRVIRINQKPVDSKKNIVTQQY